MKHTKKTLALLLSTSMLLSPFSNGLGKPQKAQAVSSKISNPGVENDVATWETVYFGHFWQNDTNGDGTIDQTDQKDPIRWRVLSVEGNDAFLLADRCLDCQAYNDTMTEATWDNSTLRSWLNGYGSESNASGIDYGQNNFINAAFTQTEQTAIKQTAVINQDPEIIHNGEDTSDKIYLLSYTEVSNPSYGFINPTNGKSNTCIATVPSYIDEKYRYLFKSYDGQEAYPWRLRTRGFFYPLAVDDAGYIDDRGKSDEIEPFGVRPVLHLDLARTELYSFGETTSSDGTQGKPIPIVTPSSSPATTDTPSALPNTTPSASPSISPDASPSGIPTVSPSALPVASASTAPTASANAAPTATPNNPSNEDSDDDSDDDPDDAPTPKPSPKAVSRFQDKKSNGEYKVLTHTKSGGTVTLGKTLKDKTKVTIPATVKYDQKTYKVTNISSKAFYGNKKLKTVTIGKNVKTIGSQAFYGCKKLTSADMGDNVTTIGTKAFYNCTALKEITLPAKVKKIGAFAFYNCRKMNELSIETKKLTSKKVGNDAFYRTGSSNYKKLIADVPMSKFSAYKKLLQKKGMSAKSVIMPAGANVDAYRPAPDPVELSKDFLDLTVKKSNSGTKYGTATVKIKRAKGVQIKTVTCNMKKHGIVTASIKGTKNLSIKVKAKKKGETKVILSIRYQLGRKTKTKKLTLGVDVALKDTRKKSNKKPSTSASKKPSTSNTATTAPKPTAKPAPTATATPLPTIPPFTTVAKDENEVAALYKIIGQQRELAAANGVRLDGIEDFDSDCYTWNEQGHLTGINWMKYNLSGNISFADFKQLKEIKCGTGTIASLDVTGNPSLTTLTCSGNALTKLDVSKNALLTTLDCHDNQITGLNLSQNIALTSLDCRNNKLTMLNLSSNSQLKDLAHDNNVLVLGYSNTTAQPATPTSTPTAKPSATPSATPSRLPSISDENAGLYDSETGKLEMGWNDLLKEGYLAYSDDLEGITCKKKSIAGVLKLSSEVSSIADNAFYRCKNLTGIVIPEGVTNIGMNAFDSCSGLTEISFPKTLRSIGAGALFGCSGLTELSLPNGITDIGYNAFSSCKKVAKLTLPNTVKTIGSSAFSGCKKLKNLTIPNSVTDIDVGAFGDCTSLTSLLIPKNVKCIGEGAFRGCSGLASIAVDAQNTAYDSRDNCNAIIETASKTLIAGCKNTVIPTDIIGIGACAFEDCSSLTDITIPDGVTSIGELAFSRCSGLSTLTIPDSVTSIGEYAFNEIKLVIYAGDASGSPWGAEYVQAYPITQDQGEADALKKLIAEKKTAGGQGEISEDLNNISQYKWDKEGHLLSITWEQCAIEGSISFSDFPYLESLYLNQNGITNLDVTGCTALKSLVCSWNALTSLDTSSNQNLEALFCGDNNLSKLDVTNNTSLGALSCYGNFLSDLDVRKNKSLDALWCSYNQLSKLDISQNIELIELMCAGNKLSELDLSQNNQLCLIYCPDNQLTALDLSNQNDPDLDLTCDIMVELINHKGDCERCTPKNAEEVEAINEIIEDQKALGAHVTRNLDDENQYFWDENGHLAGINWENCYLQGTISFPNLIPLKNVNIQENKIKQLHISDNHSLIELRCWDNQLTSLDANNDTALTELHCGNNQLTSLDVSDNIALIELYCDNNQLTSLDASGNTALTKLNCDDNQLLSLDVSGDTALTELCCNNNQLTSLDVNTNIALKELWCQSNKLTTLDLSKNTKLEQLNCDDNELTSLDVNTNIALKELWCQSNKLTALDLSKNIKLEALNCDDFVKVIGYSKN